MPSEHEGACQALLKYKEQVACGCNTGMKLWMGSGLGCNCNGEGAQSLVGFPPLKHQDSL